MTPLAAREPVTVGPSDNYVSEGIMGQSDVITNGDLINQVELPQQIFSLWFEEVRLHRVQRFRNIFGALTLAILLVAVVCFFKGLSAYPALALASSCFGIFAVFAMKSAGK